MRSQLPLVFVLFLLFLFSPFGWAADGDGSPTAGSTAAVTPKSETPSPSAEAKKGASTDPAKKGSKQTETSASFASPNKPEASILRPDFLRTKTYLEDLISKRYAQDLASLVEKDSFSVSTQIDLRKTKDGFEGVPADLTVGAVNPDDWLGDGYDDALGSLSGYEIRSLEMNVGLKSTLDEEVRSQVQEWLNGRLKKEFGAVAKGNVAFIRSPTIQKAETKPSGFLGWLSKFQDFAGQLAVALAILLGAILWRRGSGSGAAGGGKGASGFGPMGDLASAAGVGGGGAEGGAGSGTGAGAAGGGTGVGAGGGGGGGDTEAVFSPGVGGATYEQIKAGVNSLAGTLEDQYEFIVRQWCQGGEEGMLKLACFAEAAGKSIGKLPVPVDAMPEVSKIFLGMPTLTQEKRKEALQKAYWDLIAVTRLGPESLKQPFSYLSGMRVGMINQILMDQNPKLKTLVSLYMPLDQRKVFLQSLDQRMKESLITTAAEMDQISRDELYDLDAQIKGKITPDTSASSVSLANGLRQLVQALSPMDEIQILPKLSGDGIEQYKRSYPSIAFIDLWKNDALAVLIQRLSPDELLTYLRLRMDQTDRMLKLAPPMTAGVVNEELDAEDTFKDDEKNALLASLAEKVQAMVKANEVDLETAFDHPAEEELEQVGQIAETASPKVAETEEDGKGGNVA